MKKLGLDLGNASCGVAISDALGVFARGVENIRFKSHDFEFALGRILELVEKEPIDTIVLGYPKNMDGSIGPQAKQSEMFKQELEAKTSVSVVLWDERLTTKMASSMMIDQKLTRKKRKKTIDQSAAVILLQSYLDSKK